VGERAPHECESVGSLRQYKKGQKDADTTISGEDRVHSKGQDDFEARDHGLHCGDLERVECYAVARRYRTLGDTSEPYMIVYLDWIREIS